ncbi:hypothetical protein MMC30_003958 [Trapelia coarctata]|nr:hypothetical protein [Trapelia coarctata]
MDLTSTPTPDPNNDIDPALAAQMGFASFGAQPTSKRRKYNPATDAVVSASLSQLTRLEGGAAGLPKKPPPVEYGVRESRRGRGGGDGLMGWMGRGGGGVTGGRGGGGERGLGRGEGVGGEYGGRGRGGWKGNEHGSSGSNNTPLGIRAPRGEEKGRGVNAGTMVNGGMAVPAEEEEEGMPGYIDSTPPDSPPHTSVHATHVGVDDQDHVKDGSTALDQREEDTLLQLQPNPSAPPIIPSHNQYLEEKEARKEEALPVRAQGREKYDWAALRRGVRNERGDMCYYDGSFVEDPWAGLVGGGGGGGSGALPRGMKGGP